VKVQNGESEMAGWASPDDPMVSVDWLAERIGAPDIRIIDASSFMPNSDRDARAEYSSSHIPGAVFFDINAICETNTELPHMMPSAEKFASRVKALGLGDGLRLVVYDSLGLFSAARVWWMFRHMGHEDIVVLDGGLPAWIGAGHQLEDMPTIVSPRHFTVRRRADLIRDMDQMREKIQIGTAQIVDARGAGRFTGAAPEPRPGLPSGHMKGAFNVPFTDVLNDDMTLKSKSELAHLFESVGINAKARIVATCGSGITACVLALALARMGRWDVPVYDGSWTEWASTPNNIIETGT
jgi:thiosulfate/3-mercaptopyruvate sulfurtransferase